MSKSYVIILAACMGTRMKSKLYKVLQPVRRKGYGRSRGDTS